MKSDIRNVHTRSDGDAERLDRAIQVFVKHCIFVVPHTGRRVRNFVPHEPDSIVTRIRFDAIDCCANPGPDRRLHSRGFSVRAEAEIRGAADNVFTVGGVVIHVALSGMRLAPGEFVRGHVLRFSKIAGACIQRGIQVIDLHDNPVRDAIMIVAAVLVRRRWKVAGKWIDPRSRTDLALVAV